MTAPVHMLQRNMTCRCAAVDGLQLGDEESEGAFRLAQYGPLNSLSTRVNEVMLRVLL